MNEYYICGSTREGVVLPREHGMGSICIQHVMDAYVLKYPDCIHVNIDVALPDPKLVAERRRNFLDGG